MLMFLPTLALSGWSLDKGMDRILILSTVTELCLAAFFSFYGSPEFSSETKANNERSTHLMGAKDEFNKWLLAQDPENTGEFYRCYIDSKTVYWSQSYNYNLDFDIMPNTVVLIFFRSSKNLLMIFPQKYALVRSIRQTQ